jgi:hypothetical protein
MNQRRIYIAGPMTGYPHHNFPAFHEAATRFRAAGCVVANPAENFGGRTDLPRESYLRADVLLLAQCDSIALLPGWEKSRGAKFEYLLAHELGLEVFDAASLRPIHNPPIPTFGLTVLKLVQDAPAESILDEARRITGGERRDDYGRPDDDFARTARMWTGILGGKLREGVEITAMDVPLCMIAVKLARQAHRHKRDNLVDIAGYARTAALVAGEE